MASCIAFLGSVIKLPIVPTTVLVILAISAGSVFLRTSWW